jgi:predicted metal-binding protein
MSKADRITRSIDPPVNSALVLVCEKCGRRVADGKKNPSHHLASTLKRTFKRNFGKGEYRAVLTGCMDLCPDDRVAIAIVPNQSAAQFCEADVDDIDAAGDAVLEILKRLAPL